MTRNAHASKMKSGLLASAAFAAGTLGMVALERALSANALAQALVGSACGPLTHDGPAAAAIAAIGGPAVLGHCAACYIAAAGFTASLVLARAAFQRLTPPQLAESA